MNINQPLLEKALLALLREFEKTDTYDPETSTPNGVLQILPKCGDPQTIHIGEKTSPMIPKNTFDLRRTHSLLLGSSKKYISSLVSPAFTNDISGGSIMIPTGKLPGIHDEVLASFTGFDRPFWNEIACIIFTELLSEDPGSIVGYYSLKTGYNESNDNRCPELALSVAVKIVREVRNGS